MYNTGVVVMVVGMDHETVTMIPTIDDEGKNITEVPLETTGCTTEDLEMTGWWSLCIMYSEKYS